MGGDHKCPVCDATFTRPQHVARHMRSHTGDRPYKCQHCGDQFARSDLLSRHINKCHAHEKRLPTTGDARRKGSASLSRATTSKQTCDQCVQSCLPCDGCNPCSKCVQRKSRCTFVKFHRQTLPSGPGHDHRAPHPSTSDHTQPYTENMLLAPFSVSNPNIDNVYTHNFTFPQIYAAESAPSFSVPSSEAIGHDYASRYRAHAEFINRNSSLPSLSSTNQFHETQPSAWLGWSREYPYPEGDLMQSQSTDQRFRNSKDLDEIHLQNAMAQHYMEDQQHSRGTGGSAVHPPTVQDRSFAQVYGRRDSVDFSSGGSSGSRSLPSSAPSSSAHLPITDTQQQHMSYQANPNGATYGSTHPQTDHPQADHQQPHLHTVNQGEGGFSSVFGLMSLDDQNVLAGISSDGAPFFSAEAMSLQPGDPDVTPMPSKQPRSQLARMRSHTTSNSHAASPVREAETKMLKDFWKDYMRTPLSGPGSAGGSNGCMPPNYKRGRVSSLPSVKTPIGEPSLGVLHGPVANGTTSHSRSTLHGNAEDLRSYEAAVMARKTLTNLNLVPRRRRSKPLESPSTYPACASPAQFRPAVEQDIPHSSADFGSMSSFASSFGPYVHEQHQHQHQHQQPPFARVSSQQPESTVDPYARPRGSLSASSRESSVSASGDDSDKEAFRPSFKRLPSQTLVPPNMKRTLFSHRPLDEDEDAHRQPSRDR